MNKFNTISVQVGIWDTYAKLTRHKNGTVTVRHPFTKETTQNNYTLGFYNTSHSGSDAKLLDQIFSDEPPMSIYGDPMDYLLFCSDYL